VFDYESRFRDSVIDRFADEYMRGAHADPLHRLQPGGEVHRPARPRARPRRRLPRHRPLCAPRDGPNGPELHRAADPARDQSYFLFATTREQLDFLRFPLGDMPKPRCARSPAS
jgi:tRNA-specific 2-thiouridylase